MQPKRPAPLKRSEPSEKREAPMNNKNDTIVTLEDLFRKTSAKPCIYYKPLTDKEVCDGYVWSLDWTKEENKTI